MPGGHTGLRLPRPALPSFHVELALCRGLFTTSRSCAREARLGRGWASLNENTKIFRHAAKAVSARFYSANRRAKAQNPSSEISSARAVGSSPASRSAVSMSGAADFRLERSILRR